ncbi:Rad17 cell cycle checkpoint protein-domain-containing protein [Phycomyces blakesleeanus]
MSKKPWTFNPEDFIMPDVPTQTKRRKNRQPETRPTKLKARLVDNINITSNKESENKKAEANQLWADKYEPQIEENLAVDPRRINAIKECIISAAGRIPHNRCKILTLTGNAGCGKSTTIRLLAKTMPYTLSEWINDTTNDYDLNHYDPSEYVSGIDDFEDFMRRAIQLDTLNGSMAPKNTKMPRKVILLDDIPDLTTAAIKDRFHRILRACLVNNNPVLVVIVVSEAWMETDLSWKIQSGDRLIGLRDIIPEDIKNSPFYKELKLNGVTKKRISTFLHQIHDAETKSFLSQRAKSIGNVTENMDQLVCMSSAEIESISEASQGDIRFAINTLQSNFFSLASTLKTNRNSRNRHGTQTESFSERTEIPGLFHSLGKALYRKRDLAGKLETSPKNLIETLPDNLDNFLSYLHENTPYFCDDISQLNTAMQCFSEGDLLASLGDWRDTAPLMYQAASTIGGIMSIPPPKKKGSMFCMKKPTIISKWDIIEKKKENRQFIFPKSVMDACSSSRYGLPSSEWEEEIEEFTSDEDNEFDSDDGGIDWCEVAKLADAMEAESEDKPEAKEDVNEEDEDEYMFEDGIDWDEAAKIADAEEAKYLLDIVP